MPDIFELSDQLLDDFMQLNPVAATYFGVAGHDDLWTDLSPAGHDAMRQFWVNALAAAEACEAPDRRSEVAKRVLIDECQLGISEFESGIYKRDVNNIVSPWQNIRTVFSGAPADTAEAWVNIIVRLETIDQALAGYQASLEAGQAEGVVAARRQIEAAIEQGHQAAGNDDSSFDGIRDQFTELASDNADIAALGDRLDAAIAHAKSAYGAMTGWFEATQLPAAPAADGVGEEQYVASAQRFLGERIDPHQLYAWGWSEVARLSSEVAAVCARIDDTKSVDEVMELLVTDPDRSAPSVESFIEIMQARQEQALEQLDGEHFEVDDRIKTIEVKTAPAGGSTAPYYTGPSEDFSRPGRVWYPVDGRTTFPLWEEVTTAYHEGFPGHHLQVGWQTAMGDELSRLHRTLVWYPGSGEGWALYAERFMGELGYLEEPDYEVGLLMSQMFRSCRIVIDIGCHLGLTIPDDADFHPGEVWNFDLAVEMLQTVAHRPEPEAISEAIRYLGWPGQAISYKVGEQAIIDLRDEWVAAGHTDLKQFHAELLSVGSLGLDLMRELVQPA